jgi:hypothetical protein
MNLSFDDGLICLLFAPRKSVLSSQFTPIPVFSIKRNLFSGCYSYGNQLALPAASAATASLNLTTTQTSQPSLPYPGVTYSGIIQKGVCKFATVWVIFLFCECRRVSLISIFCIVS